MIPTQPLSRVDILLGMFRRHTAQEQRAVLEALLAQPELAQAAREYLAADLAGGALTAPGAFTTPGSQKSVEDIW